MAKILCLAMYMKSKINSLTKEKINIKLLERLKVTLDAA